MDCFPITMGITNTSNNVNIDLKANEVITNDTEENKISTGNSVILSQTPKKSNENKRITSKIKSKEVKTIQDLKNYKFEESEEKEEEYNLLILDDKNKLELIIAKNNIEIQNDFIREKTIETSHETILDNKQSYSYINGDRFKNIPNQTKKNIIIDDVQLIESLTNNKTANTNLNKKFFVNTSDSRKRKNKHKKTAFQNKNQSGKDKRIPTKAPNIIRIDISKLLDFKRFKTVKNSIQKPHVEEAKKYISFCKNSNENKINNNIETAEIMNNLSRENFQEKLIASSSLQAINQIEITSNNKIDKYDIKENMNENKENDAISQLLQNNFISSDVDINKEVENKIRQDLLIAENQSTPVRFSKVINCMNSPFELIQDAQTINTQKILNNVSEQKIQENLLSQSCFVKDTINCENIEVKKLARSYNLVDILKCQDDKDLSSKFTADNLKKLLSTEAKQCHTGQNKINIIRNQIKNDESDKEIHSKTNGKKLMCQFFENNNQFIEKMDDGLQEEKNISTQINKFNKNIYSPIIINDKIKNKEKMKILNNMTPFNKSESGLQQKNCSEVNLLNSTLKYNHLIRAKSDALPLKEDLISKLNELKQISKTISISKHSQDKITKTTCTDTKSLDNLFKKNIIQDINLSDVNRKSEISLKEQQNKSNAEDHNIAKAENLSNNHDLKNIDNTNKLKLVDNCSTSTNINLMINELEKKIEMLEEKKDAPLDCESNVQQDSISDKNDRQSYIESEKSENNKSNNSDTFNNIEIEIDEPENDSCLNNVYVSSPNLKNSKTTQSKLFNDQSLTNENMLPNYLIKSFKTEKKRTCLGRKRQSYLIKKHYVTRRFSNLAYGKTLLEFPDKINYNNIYSNRNPKSFSKYKFENCPKRSNQNLKDKYTKRINTPKSSFNFFNNFKFTNVKNKNNHDVSFPYQEEDSYVNEHTQIERFPSISKSKTTSNLRSKINSENQKGSLVMKNKENESECAICLEKVYIRSILDVCNHEFCKECIFKWSTLSNECPNCKEVYKRIWYFENNKKKSINVKEKKFTHDEEDSEAWLENCSDYCMVCKESRNEHLLLVCDKCCYNVCHTYCDGLDLIPDEDWYCHECDKNKKARNNRINYNYQIESYPKYGIRSINNIDNNFLNTRNIQPNNFNPNLKLNNSRKRENRITEKVLIDNFYENVRENFNSNEKESSISNQRFNTDLLRRKLKIRNINNNNIRNTENYTGKGKIHNRKLNRSKDKQIKMTKNLDEIMNDLQIFNRINGIDNIKLVDSILNSLTNIGKSSIQTNNNKINNEKNNGVKKGSRRYNLLKYNILRKLRRDLANEYIKSKEINKKIVGKNYKRLKCSTNKLKRYNQVNDESISTSAKVKPSLTDSDFLHSNNRFLNSVNRRNFHNKADNKMTKKNYHDDVILGLKEEENFIKEQDDPSFLRKKIKKTKYRKGNNLCNFDCEDFNEEKLRKSIIEDINMRRILNKFSNEQFKMEDYEKYKSLKAKQYISSKK